MNIIHKFIDNILPPKNGLYDDACRIIGSHIKHLESAYAGDGELVSFDMFAGIPLYKPISLAKGVDFKIISVTDNKISGMINARPKTAVNPQWHDVNEKFIIMSGSINLSIEDMDITLKKNDSKIVPAGIVHSAHHPVDTVYIVEFIKIMGENNACR